MVVQRLVVVGIKVSRGAIACFHNDSIIGKGSGCETKESPRVSRFKNKDSRLSCPPMRCARSMKLNYLTLFVSSFACVCRFER